MVLTSLIGSLKDLIGDGPLILILTSSQGAQVGLAVESEKRIQGIDYHLYLVAVAEPLQILGMIPGLVSMVFLGRDQAAKSPMMSSGHTFPMPCPGASDGGFLWMNHGAVPFQLLVPRAMECAAARSKKRQNPQHECYNWNGLPPWNRWLPRWCIFWHRRSLSGVKMGNFLRKSQAKFIHLGTHFHLRDLVDGKSLEVLFCGVSNLLALEQSIDERIPFSASDRETLDRYTLGACSSRCSRKQFPRDALPWSACAS